MKYLILVLALSGCATYQGYNNTVKTWVGGTEDQLISVWGVPTSSHKLDNGDRIVQYLDEDGHDCKTMFTIGPDKIIKKYNFLGYGCRSF